MALLYVVGTPIGNLGELSPRALEALRDCGLVLAEDTRVTRKLLSALQIPGKRLVSCFQHNEAARAEEIVGRMAEEDLTVCLVTDAGRRRPLPALPPARRPWPCSTRARTA